MGESNGYRGGKPERVPKEPAPRQRVPEEPAPEVGGRATFGESRGSTEAGRLRGCGAGIRRRPTTWRTRSPPARAIRARGPLPELTSPRIQLAPERDPELARVRANSSTW
jgi:hypothetical protein